MADYPTTLPIPDYGSYTGVSDHGLVRTSVPVAAPSQVVGFNSPTTKITMTFSMDNDTYVVWLAWVTDNGWNWFNMPVVSPLNPVLITSTHSVRFISELAYQKRGDNWLSVSVTAEMIPGEAEDPLAPTGRDYNFIIAVPEGGGGSGDQYYDNVVSLLHFDGNLTDQKGKIWTTEGSAFVDTGAGVFSPTGALNCVTGNTSLANTPGSTDFEFEDGDFTVEVWMYADALQTELYDIVSCRDTPLENGQWVIRGRSQQLIFSTSKTGSSWATTTTYDPVLVTSTWQHIAMTRSGDTIYAFHQGILLGTDTVTGSLYAGNKKVNVGGSGTFSGEGFSDELRITKGVARYTSNFTPPSAPFPNNGLIPPGDGNIIAGTPIAPSVPFIEANIYNYEVI